MVASADLSYGDYAFDVAGHPKSGRLKMQLGLLAVRRVRELIDRELRRPSF